MSDALLVVAARRAYERGRVKRGVRLALLPLPLFLLPLQDCAAAGRGALMLTVIAAASALIALFHWRGEDYARGANVGFIAGLSPLLFPVATRWVAPICSTTVCELMPAASIAGGFIAALCLAGGSFSREQPGEPRFSFWFSALAVTVTLGAAGCLHIGLSGLAGMALGMTFGALPVLAGYAFRTR